MDDVVKMEKAGIPVYQRLSRWLITGDVQAC
jgi:hypothetical protein